MCTQLLQLGVGVVSGSTHRVKDRLLVRALIVHVEVPILGGSLEAHVQLGVHHQRVSELVHGRSGCVGWRFIIDKLVVLIVNRLVIRRNCLVKIGLGWLSRQEGYDRVSIRPICECRDLVETFGGRALTWYFALAAVCRYASDNKPNYKESDRD